MSLRLMPISSMPAFVAISNVGPRSLTSISTRRSSSLPSRRRSRSFSRVRSALSEGSGCGGMRRSSRRSSALQFGAVGDLVEALFAHHVDGDVHQVADHGFDVAADVADFGELAGLDLEEGRIGQAGQAAGELGLADAGGADHEDVLGHHLLGHLGGQFLAADAVAEGDGDGALGLGLADHVLVEFADDFARGQFVEQRLLIHGLAGQVDDHGYSSSS